MKFKLLVIATALLGAATAWGHHGRAAYDQTKSLHLSGTVSRTEWANPHVMIHLNVTGADGKAAEWVVECPPPNWMKRAGLPESIFEAGTELAVDGYPAKDGSNRFAVSKFSVSQNGQTRTVLSAAGWP